MVNGNEWEKALESMWGQKERGNIVGGQTYPRLLHFFFLQRRAPRAEKHVLGKGVRVERRERETQLRTGKTTKTTEKKQLHHRIPEWKKKNQMRRNHMITPPRTWLIFFSLLNLLNKWKKECSHFMPTMCESRQLLGETVARRSSCLTEMQCRNLGVWTRLCLFSESSRSGGTGVFTWSETWGPGPCWQKPFVRHVGFLWRSSAVSRSSPGRPLWSRFLKDGARISITHTLRWGDKTHEDQRCCN